MEEPQDRRRDSQEWWETDELITLVDAITISGLTEAELEALIASGKIATIQAGGIRYFRLRDMQLFAVPK